ncbi:hypothetical protein MLC52_10925 [Sulfurimonas sp. NW15]|uniref:hypothetical protein n=1 Tax=Sulfurimonas sp. NW15 TaxID=2922729 RepID=UPI003DA853C9
MNINIKELQEHILNDIKNVPSQNSFDYTTFGKEIEVFITDSMSNYFTKIGISKFKIAPDKNYFPDFELIDDKIALEIKAGRNNANPENDMGTLNSWTKKLNKFNDNIYYVFVKYGCDDDDTVNKIDDVFIDKVYKFIGENRAGTLKYREKDGNLRPKSWEDFESGTSYVHNITEFKTKLNSTNLYRAYRIAAKKIKDLQDYPEYMEKLKKEFFSN